VARNTIAKINLSNLHANLDLLIEIASGSKIVAVVKANAYGNGAVEVALSIANKVDILAVAFLAEAIELRAAGITAPILILQGPHEEDDLFNAGAVNLIWMLHSEWQLSAFAQYKTVNATDCNNRAWLKFDTGMHRLGLPIEDLSSILMQYNNIIDHNTVLVTHLANADDPSQTDALRQIDTFLATALFANLPICIANSATNIRFDQARGDYVRLGIAMYGATPFVKHDKQIELAPVMALESPIIALRTIAKGEAVGYGSTWRAPRRTLIATVAIGYADGYPRHAPSNTPAWCNDQIIPLVGRVSMDMLTFDVTDLESACIGDTVQLWGDKLPINDVASHVGTIAYELMTRVSKRVVRQYLGPNY
jgi:alanine racemase